VRAVILTNDQSNQIALVNKLAEHIDVAAVVFSKNVPRRSPSVRQRLRTFSSRISGRLFGRPFVNAWHDLLVRYSERYPTVPVDRQIHVPNINAPDTIAAIEQYSPDLVLVSGTNIVGRRVIETARRHGRIMNLHTGISPYVKGGPNCTNWCLAKGWFHLIGNTVMWLDAGIDTGNIVATERTQLDGTEDLLELHWKVMEHAHDLYVRAVGLFAGGATLPDVPQDQITEGNLFYSHQWAAAPMRDALKNFDLNYRQFFVRNMPDEDTRLFPLAE
jgi:folate-dependent phosphoribosylglycinamide formyltransferase PurN